MVFDGASGFFFVVEGRNEDGFDFKFKVVKDNAWYPHQILLVDRNFRGVRDLSHDLISYFDLLLSYLFITIKRMAVCLMTEVRRCNPFPLSKKRT